LKPSITKEYEDLKSHILKSKSKTDFKKSVKPYSTQELSSLFAKLSSVERSDSCLVRAHYYFFVRNKPWAVSVKMIEKELDHFESDEFQKTKVLHKEFELKAALFSKKLTILRMVIKREMGVDKEVLSKI